MKNNKKKAAFSAKEISLIAIFSVLTAVLAQIAVPLPFTPVPISIGLVAVYTAGILLKPKHAVFSQLCYLTLGAIGVPVFGGFRGGIGALFGPTGGYLLVYPIMAWIVAKSLNSPTSLNNQTGRISNRAVIFVKAGISICIAHMVLYIGGTIWLSITTGSTFLAALSLAVFPFVLFDIIKIAFCIIAIVPFRLRLQSMNLLMLDDKAFKVKSV